MNNPHSLPEQIELQQQIKNLEASNEFLSCLAKQAMENAKLALEIADSNRWRPVAELTIKDKPVTVAACRAGSSWVSIFMLWPDGCWTDQDENILPTDELPTHFMTVPAIPGK